MKETIDNLEVFQIVVISIFLGIFNGFIITLAKKIGLIDFLSSKTTIRLVYNLLNCNFCLAFWIACIQVTFLYYSDYVEWYIIAAPFLSSSVTNALLCGK